MYIKWQTISCLAFYPVKIWGHDIDDDSAEIGMMNEYEQNQDVKGLKIKNACGQYVFHKFVEKSPISHYNALVNWNPGTWVPGGARVPID